MSHRAGQIARATNLPVIADAETGFGEPMIAARSIQLCENVGLVGVPIDDQVNTTRCGHLDGKEVVNAETAGRRIRASVEGRRDQNFVIISRSDSRILEGMDGLLKRLERYVSADALFSEALLSLEEFERVSETFGVPILANMTEFVNSPLWTKAELEDAGAKIIIHSVSLLRLAMKAAEDGLRALKNLEKLGSQVPSMQTRSRLYELLKYENCSDFDSSILNLRLDG